MKGPLFQQVEVLPRLSGLVIFGGSSVRAITGEIRYVTEEGK